MVKLERSKAGCGQDPKKPRVTGKGGEWGLR